MKKARAVDVYVRDISGDAKRFTSMVIDCDVKKYAMRMASDGLTMTDDALGVVTFYPPASIIKVIFTG